MATSTPAAQATVQPTKKFCPVEILKPYLNPYYITFAVVLGAITVGFAVVTTLLIIVATNFNVLGFIE